MTKRPAHRSPKGNNESIMAATQLFVELTETEQHRAGARFLDARPDDGYRYELDRNGRVLCRARANQQDLRALVQPTVAARR